MKSAIILEDYLDYAKKIDCVKKLRKRINLLIYKNKAKSIEETIQRVKSADIIIAIRDRVIFDKSLISNMKNVKLISACGARIDHIDIDAATENKIMICVPPPNPRANITKYHTAEQTWNLILGLTKDTTLNHEALIDGRWQTRPSRGLTGKTLGLLGIGEVGRQVANIGNAFKMRVIAWSPHLTAQLAGQYGVEAVPFKKVFSEADIVSIHAPLNEESRNMIGTKELSLMRPHALLINTARAAIVNEKALRQALESQTIGGAGLDVYWKEPLPANHWLRLQKGVLLQPHLGGFSEDGYTSLISPAVDNVLSFLDGKPKNVVNPEASGR